MSAAPRTALFISHANPESNAFTLWLGAKLTALGFEVFADIMRLKGGNDWERILEDAIRNKAGKFLLVATALAVEKQGVRNEIKIASATAKKISDHDFIVPLRLEEFNAPLGIVHAQWIDFSKGWSLGLAELLELLKPETTIVPAATPNNADFWRSLQLKDERAIGPGPETLISNWLPIAALPPVLHFYDFKAGINIGAAEKAKNGAKIPLVQQNRGFLSFAPLHELQEYFGPDFPLDHVAEVAASDFLEAGWPELKIRTSDARRKFTDLARRALDNFFESKSLLPFEIANGNKAWWPPASEPLRGMLSFSWTNGPRGRRQIIGKSEKRGFHWHYGVVCAARSAPILHIRVAARVIFTRDGREIYGDAARLHRLRRSFCRGWRNDKWRDLLLAFWYWISDGANSVEIPFGDGVSMRLALPPKAFEAAFGIVSSDDAISGDDGDDEDISDEDIGRDEPEARDERPDDEDEE
jgi:hypothetical protein